MLPALRVQTDMIGVLLISAAVFALCWGIGECVGMLIEWALSPDDD